MTERPHWRLKSLLGFITVREVDSLKIFAWKSMGEWLLWFLKLEHLCGTIKKIHEAMRFGDWSLQWTSSSLNLVQNQWQLSSNKFKAVCVCAFFWGAMRIKTTSKWMVCLQLEAKRPSGLNRCTTAATALNKMRHHI